MKKKNVVIKECFIKDLLISLIDEFASINGVSISTFETSPIFDNEFGIYLCNEDDSKSLSFNIRVVDCTEDTVSRLKLN